MKIRNPAARQTIRLVLLLDLVKALCTARSSIIVCESICWEDEKERTEQKRQGRADRAPSRGVAYFHGNQRKLTIGIPKLEVGSLSRLAVPSIDIHIANLSGVGNSSPAFVRGGP